MRKAERSSFLKYCRFNLNGRRSFATERILTSKARSIVSWTSRSHRFLVGKFLHGKAMSYNNFLDANSALELVKEYDETAVAIIKHNNPCGVALGATPVEAYVKARETDPISAFGGVIAFNRPVDLAAAKEITSTFVEVVIAPGFAEDALAELKRKKDLRLLNVGRS